MNVLDSLNSARLNTLSSLFSSNCAHILLTGFPSLAVSTGHWESQSIWHAHDWCHEYKWNLWSPATNRGWLLFSSSLKLSIMYWRLAHIRGLAYIWINMVNPAVYIYIKQQKKIQPIPQLSSCYCLIHFSNSSEIFYMCKCIYLNTWQLTHLHFIANIHTRCYCNTLIKAVIFVALVTYM